MTSLRIQQLADRTGVPATTLRYYEQVGLLPAERTPTGYRIYDEHAVERLRFITAAKRLRLSLDAIRDLLVAWEDQPCRTVKGRLRPLIMDRLGETRDGITALTDLASALDAGLARLDALPDREHRCDPSCTFLADPAIAGPATPAARDAAEPTLPSDEPLLVACSLSSAAQRDRLEHWHALLAGGGIDITPAGATVRLPASRAGEIATLVVAEQQCCPFLGFNLRFDGSVLQLVITADDPALLAPLFDRNAGISA